MDKKTALEILGTAYYRSDSVKNSSALSADFIEWRNFSQSIINRIYGEASQYAKDFAAVKFEPGQVAYRVTPAHRIHSYVSGIASAREILAKIIREMRINGDQILSQPKARQASHGGSVLIIYGKDTAVRDELAEFLRLIRLNPVFADRNAENSPVIEQIEAFGEIAYAIGIITPDELGLFENGQEALKLHASQPAVFELGYALGKFGKGKVLCIYRQGVELPFASSELACIPIDQESWKLKLAREMRDAGLPLDLNQLI